MHKINLEGRPPGTALVFGRQRKAQEMKWWKSHIVLERDSEQIKGSLTLVLYSIQPLAWLIPHWFRKRVAPTGSSHLILQSTQLSFLKSILSLETDFTHLRFFLSFTEKSLVWQNKDSSKITRKITFHVIGAWDSKDKLGFSNDWD